MGTILIVDDQLELRLLLRKILEDEAFTCLEASDGDMAVQLLTDHLSVNLVLTDFNMPRLDGLQLLYCMKTHSKLKSIPVIFTTADHSEELRLKAALNGADAVLLKPFNLMELRECIHRFLAPLRVA